MTEHHLYCRVSYWKGHSASSATEDWDRCVVSPLGMYTHGEQTFEVEGDPKDREKNRERINYRVSALISFLDKVYELGRSHAKREIREVLGVKDPR